MADNKKRKSSTKPKKGEKRERNRGGRKSGPSLPLALRKQLDSFKDPNRSEDEEGDDIFVAGNGNDDVVVDSDEGELNYRGKSDVYEYEEEAAEEESKKNRRYDVVDNFEYRLPDDFKDEDVLSEDDDDDKDDLEHDFGAGGSSEGEEDEGRHARMLQDITGISSEAFEGKKRKKIAIVSESYPESEFNPSRDVLSGNSQISIQDLLEPLERNSKLRKGIKHVEKKGISIQAPLPKPLRERVERGAGYEVMKNDATKWEGLIKRNREAPTIFIDQTIDTGNSTLGAIASGFKPRTDFEKTMESLVHDDEVMEAFKNDGSKLLELNKLSVEEVKERQDRLAKMRFLLFRHDLKAKHAKKIKSKTYHRIKKRERLRTTAVDFPADSEAARELAEKQERKRAEARMTLRHKNQGKWAKRILERGLDKQDEGTRAAISEQLHKHNLLTRKMNSMKDSSSDDNSSEDDDDDDICSSDEDGASKLLTKAKQKTSRLLELDDDIPDSGVFSLPFMVRGMEKRKEAANEEAKHAIEDYESSLKQLDKNADKEVKGGIVSGRRVFGATRNQVADATLEDRPDIDNYGSDSEDFSEEKDNVDTGHVKGNNMQKDVNIDLDVLREGLDSDHDSEFKSFDDDVEIPGPKTTHDVSVFASGSWKKMKSRDKQGPSTVVDREDDRETAGPSLNNHVGEDADEGSDSDSDGQMIDGMLSSGPKETYQLPTNEELIRRAFAGDDVEEEFQKDKEKVLNEEIPEPEKPVLLPGWGQWTHVQKKRGPPSWMLEEHANAKRKREEALKKRPDAHLQRVIISDKIDKKADKLYTKTLPYPFKSKEVFEGINRMPIGPDFNPATTARALIRPDIVKRSGVIIKPVKYEDVNPHEKGEEQKQGGRKRSAKSQGACKKAKNGKKSKKST